MTASRQWLRMKQFLPSVALKIAFNVQSWGEQRNSEKREAC